MFVSLRSRAATPRFVLLLAALSLAAPLPVAARATTVYVLKSTGVWQMDYSRDSCNLLHEFKDEAGHSLVLRLEEFAPGPDMSLSLIGEPAASPDRLVDVTTTFLPGGAPNEHSSAFTATMAIKGKQVPVIMAGEVWMTGGSKEKGAGDVIDDHDRYMSAAQLASLKSIVVDATSIHKRYELLTGPLDKVMAAMDQCTDSLVKAWGLDPTEQKMLTHPTPKGNPGTWVTTADYPMANLRMGQSAMVHFRLMIDSAGEVSGCAVQDVAPTPDFAKLSCDLLKRRAHFKPAEDASGVAHGSYYVNAVRWIIRGQ